MELDLNELECLANAAAPGPWRRQDFYSSGSRNGVDDSDGNVVCSSYNRKRDADFDFIAGANPAVVLELVRRLREAEKDAERYRWLRALPKGSCHGSGMTIIIANARPDPCSWMNDSVRGDDMDAAIDAAMQSTEAGG